MNAKIVAVIAVIVIVVAAAAAYVVTRDGGDTGSDTGLSEIRSEIYPGDEVSWDVSYSLMGEDYTSTSDMRVTSTDGSYYMEAVMTTDGEEQTTQATYDSFMNSIVMSDEARAMCTQTGTETIDTVYGPLECDVFEVDSASGVSFPMEMWVADNGQIVRMVITMDILGISIDARMDLSSTTMDDAAPDHGEGVLPCVPAQPGDVVDYLSLPVEAGDGFTVTISSSAGSSEMSYEVTAVDGDDVTYVLTVDGAAGAPQTVTTGEFLELLAPTDVMLEGTLYDTQVVETVAGPVLCDKYFIMSGGEYLNLYCSVNTGVLYLAELMDSNGTVHTIELTECSLLVQ